MRTILAFTQTGASITVRLFWLTHPHTVWGLLFRHLIFSNFKGAWNVPEIILLFSEMDRKIWANFLFLKKKKPSLHFLYTCGSWFCDVLLSVFHGSYLLVFPLSFLDVTHTAVLFNHHNTRGIQTRKLQISDFVLCVLCVLLHFRNPRAFCCCCCCFLNFSTSTDTLFWNSSCCCILLTETLSLQNHSVTKFFLTFQSKNKFST